MYLYLISLPSDFSYHLSQRALNSFFEADMERVFEVEDSPERETSPKPKRQKVEEKPPGAW